MRAKLWAAIQSQNGFFPDYRKKVENQIFQWQNLFQLQAGNASNTIIF
jgi:hypothetical protein